jgi:hypothetical protein
LDSKGNEVTPTKSLPPPVVNPFAKLSEDDLFNKLSNVVTPLWNIPYHKQLEIKRKKNVDILTELTKLVRRKKHLTSNLCPVEDVIPSVCFPLTIGLFFYVYFTQIYFFLACY